MVVDAAWAGWSVTVAKTNKAKIQMATVILPMQRSILRVHVLSGVCPIDMDGFMAVLRNGLTSFG
jgi:hypothetical protein